MSNYAKLKTNLKLAIQRCKLLEKKKSKITEFKWLFYSNFHLKRFSFLI